MKKPPSKTTARSNERPQGKAKASGVNKDVRKEPVPQKVAENRYGQPTSRQKL